MAQNGRIFGHSDAWPCWFSFPIQGWLDQISFHFGPIVSKGNKVRISKVAIIMESIKTEQTKECDSLKDEPSVNDNYDLKGHSLSKSVKQKHHCDHCDYQTYRNYDLKSHIQSKVQV